MIQDIRRAAVALFVRIPVPGRVKTRLACDLGNEAACDLYRAMVADCVKNISSVGLPLYLFHDGNESGGLPRTWCDATTAVIRQSGERLGDRMAAAFENLFSVGCERVILTGSDIPGVDGELLLSALSALDRSDTVFSPAVDGGYCLVASRKERFNRRMFDDIPWSTHRVMELTRAACEASGLSYTLLDSRQDIDTLDDLHAYCRSSSPTARSTNAWLISHGYNLADYSS